MLLFNVSNIYGYSLLIMNNSTYKLEGGNIKLFGYAYYMQI